MIESITPPWNERFGVYQTHRDGQPLMIRVDLGAQRHAPLESAPVRWTVCLQFNETDTRRWPPREIFEQLNEIEDHILGSLSNRGVIFVGRVLGLGQSRWVFHAPPAPAEDAWWIDQLSGVEELDVWIEHDPDWRFYREVLLPDVHEQHWMNNQLVLHQHHLHGDSGTLPRVVEHAATFTSEPLARAAARSLSGLGYHASAPAAQPKGDGGEIGHWVLCFSRLETLAFGRINEITSMLIREIAAFEGQYDGWGAPLVSAAATA